MPVERPVRPSSTTSFAARTVQLFSGMSFSILIDGTVVDHHRISVKVVAVEHPRPRLVASASVPGMPGELLI